MYCLFCYVMLIHYRQKIWNILFLFHRFFAFLWSVQGVSVYWVWIYPPEVISACRNVKQIKIYPTHHTEYKNKIAEMKNSPYFLPVVYIYMLCFLCSVWIALWIKIGVLQYLETWLIIHSLSNRSLFFIITIYISLISSHPFMPLVFRDTTHVQTFMNS